MSDHVVTIAEVRAMANRLCDAIEARGQSAAKVDKRAYWDVYFEDMFNDGQPAQVVGDVLDDLHDARLDLIEATEAPIVWHAAQHLAGLVKFLAYADSKGTLV